MRRIAMTMLAALLLAQPLPQDAAAQDAEICALQDQQVRVLRRQVAQLQRQLWYASIKSRRHDLWLDRCLGYGRSLRGELETCREELASCEEELRICADPCRDVSCQPWQECRVYEPTGEAFCADTCNGFQCPAGTRCELVDVVCVRAPCPPVAECAPDDVCQLPPDVGPCDAIVPRWFHNGGTGECEPFTWGGCGGNGNNFETREACERSCPPANACELPPETGPCEAAILRWYHDAFTDQCTTFTYGGCGGNANNFQTYEDCVQACPRRSDRCELPAETGPCAAAFLRWHFNRETGSCETFTWGGCGGNENRFETLDDCMFTCGLTP